MIEGTKYRDWTIIKNSDGYIALDPKGSNSLPGGGAHTNEKDAKKSIDFYILAAGDPQLFHLLWGGGGWDLYAAQGSNTEVNGDTLHYLRKRDNKNYEPTYEYEHRVAVSGDHARVSIKDARKLGGYLTPESALALSNVLRRAAIHALEPKK